MPGINPMKTVNASQLGNLPGPAKAGAAILSGAGIMTIAWYATDGNRNAMLIVGLGFLAVMLLLGLYKMILKWFDKRRASPLSQGLAGNAAAAPTGVSEPARRARLEDLRRNFDQGVEKFRAAGKNMYSVPWYVLVGEPGSGKTEAIRHCNVGFPPGLQDQLQGAGGTLNMNWWFTNSAIILDTAGRLMFEEVVPGTTNEWNEFLALLKKNRPNCPINGMLLVIPVDTLIKDTSDSIEKKATKIAQQFDQIQRILGVRFPVFVIITKCDLINGFREFFDDLNDPQLQHQMMGWSNPASLDERFDPSAVTTHLEAVKQRLIDRRRQLLLDPVNTEDPNGRRADQVDALYALPAALMDIAPRLRRYLETIFVAGDWSPKPLFLRGIYFTSSMTEGSALDAELAGVLGVSVDALPEGRVWRRDRAYFLRDLFIEKVFRERGLVTRASNAGKQQRTRRMIILTFGFLAVISLGLLTWFGHRQLENSIGKHRDFWNDASKVDVTKPPNRILSDAGRYSTDGFTLGKGPKSDVAQMFAYNLPLVQEPINVPVIYRPLAKFVSNPDTARRDAYRAFFEAAVLNPVFQRARSEIINRKPEDWNHDAVLATAQLMKVQYALATGGSTPAGEPHVNVTLDPLFHFILTDSKDLAAYNNDAAGLQQVTDWIYTPASGATKDAWPAKAIAADSADARLAVSKGVEKTLAYWQSQVGGTSPTMADITAVKTALADFAAADQKLAAQKFHPVESRKTYFQFADDWHASYADLQKARDAAIAAWSKVIKDTSADPQTATLQKLYAAEIDRVNSSAQKDYQTLLHYTLEKQPADNSSQAATELHDDHDRLQKALDDEAAWQTDPKQKAVLAQLSEADNTYLALIKGTDDTQHHRFEVAAQVYQVAEPFVLVEAQSKPTELKTSLTPEIAKTDSDVADKNGILDKIRNQTAGTPQDALTNSVDAAKFAINAGIRNKRYMLAIGALMPFPDSPEQWKGFIQKKSGDFSPNNLKRPPLPLVRPAEPNFNAQFSADAVAFVNDAFDSARKLVAEPTRVLDAPDISTRADTLYKPFTAYRDTFRDYWTHEVFTDDMKPTAKDWTDFSTQLSQEGEKSLRGELQDYGKKVADALSGAGLKTDAADVNAALARQEASSFQSEASSVLSYWKNLGDKPEAARTTILSLTPSDFQDKYVLGKTSDLDNFVFRYWHSVETEGLRVLAVAGQQNINAGLAKLAQFQKFPLWAQGPKGTDLAPKDINDAHAVLVEITGSVPGLANPSGPANTIGQGALTRDKDFDEQLDILCGTKLLANQRDYLNNLAAMLAALPVAPQTYTVTVTVNKEKMKDPSSISQKYTYMLMSQGKGPSREAYFGGTNPDQLEIKYPDDDFVLGFRETPGGPIRSTETFSGPWAVLRLIKDAKDASSTDGLKWTITYEAADNTGKKWPLYLTLEFKTALPADLKKWPGPK